MIFIPSIDSVWVGLFHQDTDLLFCYLDPGFDVFRDTDD